MLDGSLRPYLAYSAAGHGLLAAAVGLAMSGGASQPSKVYRIDFIGSTPQILNREQGGPAPAPVKPQPPAQPRAAQKPPPQTDPDAFNMRKRRQPLPLPRPSFLPDSAPAAPTPAPKAPPKPEAKAPEAPAASASAVPAAPAGQGASQGPGATVSPDMDNFPYPWYISRVRTVLWDKWSAAMPASEGECTVVFTILRAGKVVDMRIELSSGDRSYDYIALSAVRDASPFPPLPDGFADSFLTVHVQFTSR